MPTAFPEAFGLKLLTLLVQSYRELTLVLFDTSSRHSDCTSPVEPLSWYCKGIWPGANMWLGKVGKCVVFTNVWAAGPLENAMSSPKFQEALMSSSVWMLYTVESELLQPDCEHRVLSNPMRSAVCLITWPFFSGQAALFPKSWFPSSWTIYWVSAANAVKFRVLRACVCKMSTAGWALHGTRCRCYSGLWMVKTLLGRVEC